MEAAPTFPDPDPFYHAKIALFLRNGVILHTFPWFQLTAWPSLYADPHFLYHLLLVPFVTLFDPMVGMKVSAVVFALVAAAVIHGFLKWLRAPWPVLLTLAATLSPALLTRLAFPRAISLSLALFTAIAWAVLAKRPKTAFVLSATFVWLYHGWPTALLILFAVGGAEIVAWNLSRQNMGAEGQGSRRAERSEHGGMSRSRGPIFCAVAVMAGLAAGTVVNPYFPELLSFSVVDIFQIGVVNEGYHIAVGSEWKPASWWDIAATCAPALLALFVGLIAFVQHAIERKSVPSRDDIVRLMTCLFLASGFTALTLKSGRYVEYALPCIVFAAGALFSIARPTIERLWIPTAREWLNAKRRRRLAAACLVVLVGISTVGTSVLLAWNRPGYRADRFAFATEWIRENVPASETMFTNTWDMASVLFYLDDTHTYLIGLDPTFFYHANPELYWLWLDIVSGKNTDEALIVSRFHARTVVVDERDPKSTAFQKALNASGLFREVARNDNVSLYTCLPECQL